MTKYEKVSTFISLVALIAAIVSPFITYYWLDPELQSFKNRAKLQVSPTGETLPRLKPTEEEQRALKDYKKTDMGSVQAAARDFREALRLWLMDLRDKHYGITIFNVGELPAKDALVTAQFESNAPVPPEPLFNPPIPADLSFKDGVQFIILKRSIAPHDKLQITFSRVPKAIWVSNEFGETSTLLPLPSISAWSALDKENSDSEK